MPHSTCGRWTALTQTSIAAAALACAAGLSGCGVNAASATEDLKARGYGADAKSVCKAAGAGDVSALRLLAQAGIPTGSLVIDSERFCLEPALIGRGGKVDVGAVLAKLKPAKAELDRSYASATGMTARDIPQAEQLARAAGYRATSLYAGGQVVEATPLMWAVWAGDQAAVEALLAHGVNPNLPSRIAVHVSGKELVLISANPLFEAHRLQHGKIAQLLTSSGGKPTVSSAKG